MTERQVAARELKKLRERLPGAWFYKPGDTFGGHKKPFDLMYILDGITTIIEYKKIGRRLEPHQRDGLRDAARSGARALVGWIDRDNRVDYRDV